MINYKLLDFSRKYYHDNGNFLPIEAPWTVTKSVANITAPKDAKHWTIEEKNKVLVASGEQSFLYLYLKGFLPKGRFQTITPCFRDESFDIDHTKYFMKNELIDTMDTSEASLMKMIENSKLFFQKYFKDKLEVRETGHLEYDIVWKDREIGSYGIRQCEYLTWVYGTGLAEPRFSNLVNAHWMEQNITNRAL